MSTNKKNTNKMNYNRIRDLLKQTKVDRTDFYQYVGMSEVGFNKMMRVESCKVSTLEAIAEYFNKPIEYFFYTENYQVKIDTNVLAEPENVAYLRNIINQKNEIIEQQKSMLELIIAKLKGGGSSDTTPQDRNKPEVKGFRSMCNDELVDYFINSPILETLM